MTSGSLSLGLNWQPFVGGRSAKNALADVLNLSGSAAPALGFSRTPDQISLSTGGTIYDKTVVSEVTTISVSSSQQYAVTKETSDEAARDAAAGSILAQTPNADGSVTVVRSGAPSGAAADSTSIMVNTSVTYSDGSTEKSTASLGADFRTTGDGLARKRLETVVAGSVSVSAILKRLGAAGPATPESIAKDAAKNDTTDAAISSEVSASLTYVAAGNQRSVSGVESGNAAAFIEAFAAPQGSYGPGGQPSTTKESAQFNGFITGGSLFSDAASSWLEASIAETEKSVTHLGGPGNESISRDTTASASFATGPTGTSEWTADAATTQFAFDRLDQTAAGARAEHITITESDTRATSNTSRTDATQTQSASSSAATTLTLRFTPITPVNATPALSILA